MTTPGQFLMPLGDHFPGLRRLELIHDRPFSRSHIDMMLPSGRELAHLAVGTLNQWTARMLAFLPFTATFQSLRLAAISSFDCAPTTRPISAG